MNGESKGGLDPKKRKRKRKGKQGFLSYHVITIGGWGRFLCFFPQTLTPSHARRKRNRGGGEEEEEGGGGDD